MPGDYSQQEVIAMSLSNSAVKNIAQAALYDYIDDLSNVEELTSFICKMVIEQEIGFSGDDITPPLFTELVSQLNDTVYNKLLELRK